MTDTDTSAEAVERLARWHDQEAGAWRSDGGNMDLARIHDLHAATLRALLTERDAARRQAERWDTEAAASKGTIARLRVVARYLTGENTDGVKVMLAGNPIACERVVALARAALREDGR